MRDGRGFTLVEIVVVLGIIGVLVAMSAGSFTNYLQKSTFDDQKATLYDVLTRTRNMANSRDECSKLTITGQTLLAIAYAVPVTGSCADPAGATTASFTATIKPGFNIENFSNGTNILIFNPTGGLTDTTSVTIFMTDPKGTRQGFMVYPVLGQIRSTNGP